VWIIFGVLRPSTAAPRLYAVLLLISIRDSMHALPLINDLSSLLILLLLHVALVTNLLDVS
jgi:hypothetical protein